MDLDTNDYDVINLLVKLKSAETQYPSDLFAARRQSYVQRVAEIGLGLGLASGFKATSKAGASGTARTTIGGLLETVLVVAIVTEAGAAAYIYRDQIADVIQTYISSTPVSEGTPPPVNASPLPGSMATELVLLTETPEATLTGTGTTTGTFLPTVVGENLEVNDQAISTPDLKGNNGNQYGLTPKPERTKDKGNNDAGGDTDKGKDK
jgi:hypothetical protein